MAFFLGVPVELILRDSLTRRKVTVPTESVIIEVTNHYNNQGNILRNNENTLASRTITITADFVNMSHEMQDPEPQLDQRKAIDLAPEDLPDHDVQAKEQAWNEGWDACMEYMNKPATRRVPRNPYHSTQEVPK